eukprot:6130979-Prymnesium_polylepis.1
MTPVLYPWSRLLSAAPTATSASARPAAASLASSGAADATSACECLRAGRGRSCGKLAGPRTGTWPSTHIASDKWVSTSSTLAGLITPPLEGVAIQGKFTSVPNS